MQVSTFTTAAEDAALADERPPPLTLAPYVNTEHIQQCYSLTRSCPLIRRATRLRLAIMFHRRVINKDSIKPDSSAGAPGQFATSVIITWGRNKEPVRTEFANMVVNFMMEEVLAKDMYGFIPWFERKVKSLEDRDITYRIPAVPKCGTFRVPQRIDPRNPFDVNYALESSVAYANSMSSGKNKSTQTKPFTQITTVEIDGLQRGALGRIGGPSSSSSSSTNGNNGGGGKAFGGHRKRGKKQGVYIVPTEEPDIDGTLASAAATAIAINEYVEQMKHCKLTADSIGANPMLVTQRAGGVGGSGRGGGGGNGFNAAQHLLDYGDLSKQRALNEMKDDERERALTQYHNNTRQSNTLADQVQSARSSITDAMTRRPRRLVYRPFYSANSYDIPASQQLVSQQLPQQPANVEAWETARQELVANAFGVTRAMIVGEQSSVKAGAELTRDFAFKVIEFDAKVIAMATQSILNQIYSERETEEIAAILAQYELKRVNKETLSDEEQRTEATLLEELNNFQRYEVTFAPMTSATLDEIIQAAQRGVFPREVEAALIANTLDLDPRTMELQAFPDPYLRPKNDDAAIALSAGQSMPKPEAPKPAAKKPKTK